MTLKPIFRQSSFYYVQWQGIDSYAIFFPLDSFVTDYWDSILRKMVTRVPFCGSLSMVISPWCASMIFWEMASPSPLPLGLEEKKGWKILSWTSWGIPVPVSQICTNTRPTCRPVVMVRVPPASMASMPFLAIFKMHLAQMTRVKLHLREVGVQFQQ